MPALTNQVHVQLAQGGPEAVGVICFGSDVIIPSDAEFMPTTGVLAGQNRAENIIPQRLQLNAATIGCDKFHLFSVQLAGAEHCAAFFHGVPAIDRMRIIVPALGQ